MCASCPAVHICKSVSSLSSTSLNPGGEVGLHISFVHPAPLFAVSSCSKPFCAISVPISLEPQVQHDVRAPRRSATSCFLLGNSICIRIFSTSQDKYCLHPSRAAPPVRHLYPPYRSPGAHQRTEACRPPWRFDSAHFCFAHRGFAVSRYFARFF